MKILNNHVLVKVDKIKPISKIIFIKKEVSNTGIIVEIGSTITQVVKNDRILFANDAGVFIKNLEELDSNFDYILMREKDLLCKLGDFNEVKIVRPVY